MGENENGDIAFNLQYPIALVTWISSYSENCTSTQRISNS